MKRKHVQAGIPCIAIGVVFLMGALLLFLANDAEDAKVAKEAGKTIALIREEMLNQKRDDLPEQKQDDPMNNDVGADPAITDKAEELARGNDSLDETVYVDGINYLGVLFIPGIELELPVSDELSETILKKVPCKYYGSIEDGLVISGHNYKSGFGRLSKVKRGDEVILVGADGTKHGYVVEEIEILNPDQVEEMIRTDFELTLYTCTFGGKQRVTVRCRKSAASIGFQKGGNA